MLNELKIKNPEIEFYGVDSAEFETFGRVITDMDISEIVAEAEKIENPKEGSSYLPGVEAFEKLSIAGEIKRNIFGESRVQIGYCWGYNTMFNATEWHTASELNIAITDMVLILGHLWDVKDGKIDSSKFKAFYLPKGTVVEVYATSLHYCPCQVSDNGFKSIVGLPLGTNTNLDGEYENSLLFRKNKWIIAHEDNKDLIEKGVFGGISGINYQIKY